MKEPGYKYLQIHSEAELIENFRRKLKQLNGYDENGKHYEGYSVRF